MVFLQRWILKAWVRLQALISPKALTSQQLVYAATSVDYLHWRHQFLWQRQGICLRLALPCLLTHAVYALYSVQFDWNSPPIIANCIRLLLLLICLCWHNSVFGRRHPGWLFLGISWSVTLFPHLLGALWQSPAFSSTAWTMAFLTQAAIMPVRWELHLVSQLGAIGCYVSICSIMEVRQLNVEGITEPLFIFLYWFWFCFVCDLSVRLYERVQRQEFESRRQLRMVLHSLSHDLTTPIMGISVVLQNLLNMPGSSLRVNRLILEELLQGGDRLLALIKTLKEAHTTEIKGIQLHNEPVQLSKLVNEVLADLAPLLSDNQVVLTNHISARLPLVRADATQLRRVWHNLIVNACHHNPSRIHISLNATVIPASPVLTSVHRTRWIRCVVQDNGVGIPDEQQPRLFELYSRGAQAHYMPGLGLGLYLCHQIITAHDGKIGLTSCPGQGATFWFTLPIQSGS